MQFSLSTLTLLLSTLFFSTSNACLVLAGTYEGKTLYVTLTDNGIQRCAWSGEYPMNQNREQFLHCAGGFASWIKLTQGVGWPVPPPAGEMAYAYRGLNFKFGVDGRYGRCLGAWGPDCLSYQYVLYAANYGCTYAAIASAADENARIAGGGNMTQPPPELVWDGSPSKTAGGVVIKTGTAKPAVKVRRKADLPLKE